MKLVNYHCSYDDAFSARLTSQNNVMKVTLKLVWIIDACAENSC